MRSTRLGEKFALHGRRRLSSSGTRRARPYVMPLHLSSPSLSSRVLSLSALALALAVTVTACGGSTSSSDAFCTAFVKAETSCETVSSACVQAITDDCPSFVGNFSAAFKAAVVSCVPAANCPSGDPFATSCFQSLDSLTTPAQSQLAADYCTSCAAPLGQTVANCTAAFWGLGDAGSVPGAGAEFLEYSDAIVQKIESTCVPTIKGGTQEACFSFIACEGSVTESAFPSAPAACTSTSAGSPADGGASFSLDGG